MRLTAITIAALLGGTSAFETEKLAEEGLAKLNLHVAREGYPNAENCTLDNVAVRREWYGFRHRTSSLEPD